MKLKWTKQTQLEKLHKIDWNQTTNDVILQNLMASLTAPIVNGRQFPLFPDAALQLAMNGASDYNALLEAYPFYKRILGYARLLRIDISPQTRVLDFGCGWGRHLRFFWQIVEANNLYGVDIDANYVRLCRELFPSGNFINNEKEPPMQFQDNFFDIVWSYSVFSHISQEYNLKWMKDIHRILKPQGMFILTTEGADFIDFCSSFRDRQTYECAWYRSLGGIFDSDKAVADSKRKFAEGTFQYFPGDAGWPRDESFYGEAIVPEKFFRDYWSSHFRIVDYYDPHCANEQVVVVAQKRTH